LVNLRYHIVSIVAVFLALGVGVVMGSTVIDRVTVDALRRQVNAVDRRVGRTQAENRRLNGQLQQLRDFADQARDHLLRGRLRDVPVLVVAVQGVDRKPVDALRQALVEAEARVEGTLWFTPKVRLDNHADAQALAQLLGVSADRPDAVLGSMLTGMATTLRGGEAHPDLLPALASAGFVAYEAPPVVPPGAATPTSVPVTLASLPLPATRFVVVSGAGAQVGDDHVAVPFTRALASDNGRVVAVEAGQDTPGGRAVFVGFLRGDGTVAGRLSTVDDLESPMGQAAAVLALEALGAARVGHFGVGPGAQRLLPPAGP
jgi:hypothetical protein